MINHIRITVVDATTTQFVATCSMCGTAKEYTVDTKAFDLWNGDVLIQKAFPEMPVDDRELLISGTCGPCFDKLFEG